VNLERRPDRKESAQEQFKISKIKNVEFFNATDGKLYSPPDIQISPPEWGCADSHIRIWRDIIEKGYETVLVFEDDVKISPGFIDKLSWIMSDMEDVEWDYINLGPSPEPFRIKGKWETEYVVRGQSLMTHCYLITNKCAKKIALWDPVDLVYSIDHQLIQVPLKMYYTKESLANQEFEYSSLIGFAKSTITGDIGFARTMPYDFIIKSSQIHVILLFIILLYVYYVTHKRR
jgi:GR25 family glycosyltransferase involved in LPS biosynthesis